MKFNEIKAGNLLRYMGRLGQYYDRPGIVTSIDPTRNGEDSFGLLVQDWQKKSEDIRAYESEVWPITLDVSHLEKLGFVKDKDHNIFRHNGLVLFRPIFIKYHEDHVEYVDKGFVVLNKPMDLPLIEEMVDSSTTAVTSLHTFQNYLTHVGRNKIDWKSFL
jgi:hypothetical protein